MARPTTTSPQITELMDIKQLYEEQEEKWKLRLTEKDEELNKYMMELRDQRRVIEGRDQVLNGHGGREQPAEGRRRARRAGVPAEDRPAERAHQGAQPAARDRRGRPAAAAAGRAAVLQEVARPAFSPRSATRPGPNRADTTDLWVSVLGDSHAAAAAAEHGRELRTMSVAQLEKLPHVGTARAARIFAVVELGRRLLSMPLVRGQALKSPEDVFAVYGKRLIDLERESFWAVYLDVKGRVICDEPVAVGSQTVCPVAPADVLRTAIRVGAVGIIVLHTHPSSGDPTPSSC